MANANSVNMPVNAPLPVTWFLASYYPTDADGQVASIVGVKFSTYNDAVTWARAQLATAGVGVVYVQQLTGCCVYPLYDPVPS